MEIFKKLVIVIAVVDFLFLNIIAFDVAYNRLFGSGEAESTLVQRVTTPIYNNSKINYCPDSCSSIIDEKISAIDVGTTEVIKETIFVTPEPTQTVVAESTPQPELSSSVSYVQIPGSGSSSNNDWTNLSGTDFYLDKSDYTGLDEITFEANIKLFNGNGIAYVRIFDLTNGIAVYNSELQTSNQSLTYLKSAPLNLWAGTNHYIIQAKSLTADTSDFVSGRLKIVQLK